MPFKIVRADITGFECDAIAVPVDKSMRGGAVLNALVSAYGRRIIDSILSSEYDKEGGFSIAEVEGMAAKYLVCVLAPSSEDDDAYPGLFRAYAACVAGAEKAGAGSVAIPLIGTGANGFNAEKALPIAVASCGICMEKTDIDVTLVLYDEESYVYGRRMFPEIYDYITAAQITESNRVGRIDRKRRERRDTDGHTQETMFCAAQSAGAAVFRPSAVCDECPETDEKSGLEDYIRQVDAGFSETLLDLIDKSGMTDVQCYKRANVDRKLFSKIRSDPAYRPKKATALSFCIALSLSLEQTNSLLAKAGYTLSHSNRGDLIVEYFIKNGKYDIFEINEALFAFDQTLLGV
ncbi:MAG: macro domain-containing protein [Clostridia bacterium]|nr:macro domain-containing protein [Clostridia bacterium]